MRKEGEICSRIRRTSRKTMVRLRGDKGGWAVTARDDPDPEVWPALGRERQYERREHSADIPDRSQSCSENSFC
eukprot:1516716-Pyramimonas_sp.AAC.1